MNRNISIIIVVLVLQSIYSHAQEKKADSLSLSNTVSFVLIDAPESTYGYDIFINNQKYIHQTSIPGRQGVRGFATKEDAEKVAHLVIGKIKKGENPPSISQAELKKLNII